MKIGIIGGGFVGQATLLLKCEAIQALVYDIDPTKRFPNEHVKLEDLSDCNFIFICVPTPMNKDGSCYTKIVEDVIISLKDFSIPHIVVRSTVPIHFSHVHNVNFMPEFLTEKNWRNDFYECERWVFGVNDKSSSVEKDFTQLIQLACKSGVIRHQWIDFLTPSEAEMVKYFRNCFLATKVSFCNEMWNFCKNLNIEYESVRRIATTDYRIGGFHTMVPGPDGKGGFGGTCFPKDMESLHFQMKQVGCQPLIINSALERNKTIDRPEMDWTEDKGRAVV